MSLLPSSPDVAPDGDPRVVGLDSEEADDLMAALSSTTARELVAELHEDPAPPSDLADRVGTTLQNAQYHLQNLEDAGVIEVVGTAYSEKGREMRIYGPADSPLVIFAGEQDRASGLRAALSRLFGGLLALAIGSLAIQQVFGASLLAGPDDDATAGSTATPTPVAGDAGGAAADTATPTSDGGDAGAFTGSEGEEAPSGTSTPETADATTTSGSPRATASDDAASDGASVATESLETTTETSTDTATETVQAASTPTGEEVDLFGLIDAAFGSGLPPGVAFFLGGATVLSLVVATTYLRTRP